MPESTRSIAAVADEVLRHAGHDVERYEGLARPFVASAGLRLHPALLATELAAAAALRKRERFRALATTTALTLCPPDGIERPALASMWKLHGLLALNLNLSQVAYTASITATEQLDDAKSAILAEAYSQVATAARNLGRHAEGVACFFKAREVALACQQAPLAAWQLFRLGKLYVNYLQQPSRGFTFVSQALSEFESLPESVTSIKGQAACIDEKGDIYRETARDVANARALYEKAASLNRTIGNQSGLARNLAHLGLCAEEARQYQDAKRLLLESIALSRASEGEARGIGLRLGQLARVCILLEQLADAEAALTEATQTSGEFRDYKALAKHEIVWAMLRARQGQVLEAKEHFLRAAELSKDNREHHVRAIAHERLGDLVRDRLGDYVAAKEQLLKAIDIRIAAWRDVSDGNGALERVEDKQETGRMYKSLFDRLLTEYQRDLEASVGAAEAAYGAALRERDQRYSAQVDLLRFGTVMAGVRHDVANAISNTVAAIQSVRVSVAPSARQILDDAVRKLQERTLMLHGPSIGKLQDAVLAGTESGESAAAVLEALFEEFKRDASRRHVRLTLSDPRKLAHLVVNATLARIVLRNIVDNAFDAIADGSGRLTVDVEPADADGRRIRVTCLDNGRGMTPAQLNEAFELGHTSKGGHGGMGLPIVRFLVESMQGEVDVQSSPASGTRIELTLPAKPYH